MATKRTIVVTQAHDEGLPPEEIDRYENEAWSMADAVAAVSKDYQILRPDQGGNFEKVDWDGDGEKVYTVTVR